MRYSVKDIRLLLKNPVGRRELLLGQLHNFWPLLKLLATGYRRSLLRKTKVIAVVGSLGKSTTTRAVNASLERPVPLVPPGNAWNSLALALLSTRPTTPHLAVEVGISHPGWMRQYARMVRPDIAIVTSIASEHHTSLGPLSGIREEKADMVRCLGADGLAVLNGDDPNVLWMAGETRAKVVTCGFGPDNDVRAFDLETVWPRGSRFRVEVQGRTYILETRLVGRHMVYPALAAIAAGLAVGRSMEAMAAGLAELPPTPGRLEPVELENGAIILRDTFKSTLESIFAGLETLGAIPARRRIAVLGEVEVGPGSMGPLYRQLGEMAMKMADRTIVLGGNRNARPFRAGAAAAGTAEGALEIAGRDWHEVGKMLAKDLGPGDVVLIKGRRTQRLDRMVLVLQGRKVGCRLLKCKCSVRICDICPMLERGWDGLPVTV